MHANKSKNLMMCSAPQAHKTNICVYLRAFAFSFSFDFVCALYGFVGIAQGLSPMEMFPNSVQSQRAKQFYERRLKGEKDITAH